jgi:2-polyprenyl-3-methyl-5-hydroxy-6-metoxy-1,4-benzoquinol methylase
VVVKLKYDLNLNLSLGSSHTLILNHIHSGSVVLEFGPATGYMTKYMTEQLNCQVYCVEIDAEAAEKVKKYATKVIIGDIEDYNWLEELKDLKFDYILFADVLEHLYNPCEVLKKATMFLQDDGAVITSIPNISHNAIIMKLLSGDFSYRETGLLDNTHIRFFAKKNVLALLEQAGLVPVQWMATMYRPENTEFQKLYGELPPYIHKFLETREDGHVYQYVTVSKKAKTSLQKIDTKIAENYLDYNYLQVFWEENGQYSEMASVKTRLKGDGNRQRLLIDLPKETSGRIRIDPVNVPGIVSIYHIKVGDKNYSVENNFQGITFSDDIIVMKDEALDLIVQSFDPQIFIDVEQSINQIVIDLSFHYYSYDIISLLQSRLINAKKNQEILEARIKKLESNINN